MNLFSQVLSWLASESTFKHQPSEFQQPTQAWRVETHQPAASLAMPCPAKSRTFGRNWPRHCIRAALLRPPRNAWDDVAGFAQSASHCWRPRESGALASVFWGSGSIEELFTPSSTPKLYKSKKIQIISRGPTAVPEHSEKAIFFGFAVWYASGVEPFFGPVCSLR